MAISFNAERYVTDLEGEWPTAVGIGTVCYALDTGCHYGWSGADWIKVPPHYATPTPSAGIMSDVNGQIDTGWLGTGTPDSGKFLRGDKVWATPPSGGGAPVDASYVTLGLDATLSAERTLAGESGVVTISDGGAGGNATVNLTAGGVANVKLANMAQNTIKGRITAGAGAPEDLSAASVRTILNVADGANAYAHPNHSGDVTSVADGAQTIAAGAVTYAKMQDVAAASRLLGRGSLAGAGDPEEITLGTNLSMSGTTLNAAGGAGGAAYLVVPICASTAANAAWTNMPAAETFLFGSYRHVTKVDLTNFTQVRLIVNKQTTAGAAASIIFVKYRTAFDATVGNYSAIGTSAVQVAINVQNTVLVSNWVDLAAGAKADVFVACAGSGGDGVLDPGFGSILLQFK